jgi:hypothetical protein
MSPDQFESLSTDIAVLRHAVIALALASPRLEDVVAEIARQQEFSEVALIPAPVNDKYIELVRTKLQGLHDLLAAQL